MLFLQEHQVSTSYAAKIYRKYGNDSIPVMKENPYRLADDIWGIGFKTADQIAMKLGFGKDSYPIVVMPIMMNHFVMLQRNLIYTGITRAKKVLVIVGTKKALAYAVKNVTVTKRNTLLKERLAGQERNTR